MWYTIIIYLFFLNLFLFLCLFYYLSFSRDSVWTVSKISSRPSVAGAVPQSALWFIHSLSQPFPPNLQNIINNKPEELGSWNFERMFTPQNLSHVTCRKSGVTCHVTCVTGHMSHVTFFFFWQSGEAFRWRGPIPSSFYGHSGISVSRMQKGAPN